MHVLRMTTSSRNERQLTSCASRGGSISVSTTKVGGIATRGALVNGLRVAGLKGIRGRWNRLRRRAEPDESAPAQRVGIAVTDICILIFGISAAN